MNTLFKSLFYSVILLGAVASSYASVDLIGYECPTSGRLAWNPILYVQADEAWVVMRHDNSNGVWEQISRIQGKNKTAYVDKEVTNGAGQFSYAVIPASQVSTFIPPPL